MTFKTSLLPVFAFAALLGVSGTAHAALPELGDLGDNKPGCPGFEPAECRIVLVRQTGFQVKVGTTRGITTVPRNGHLVAWTVPLASVTEENVKKANASYGGAPSAGIVVLSGLGKSHYKVVRKGPMVDVTDYLGTEPTFALPNALPVKKGEVVALTVPTWAPVIQLGLGADTSWRSSRPLKEAAGGNFATQRALVGSTTQASFAGLFQRARLTYSATFVPSPTPAKRASSSTKSSTKKSTTRK